MKSQTRIIPLPQAKKKHQRTAISNEVQGATGTPKKKGVKKKDVKVIMYGTRNQMPNEIITAVSDSGTATLCWERLDSFLQADGFSDKKAAKFQVNPDEKGDELLNILASDYSLFRAVALRVKYDTNKKVAEVYHVPVQTVRKRDDDTFLVNPTFGAKKYDVAQDEILRPFDPSPEAVQEMFDDYAEILAKLKEGQEDPGQPGQLLYVFRKTTKNIHYSVPPFWTLAGSSDIKTDVEIALTDLEAVENNFQPGAIIYKPGIYDDKNKDEHGLSQLDYLQQDVEGMTSKENRGRSILLTGAPNEEPKLITFDNSKQFTKLDDKRDTIAKAVCRHFGIHPVLAGINTQGQLGQTQEIVNAIQLLQSDVNKWQRQITSTMAQLFEGIDWTISTLSPLKYVPSEVLAKMTDDEIRNLGGLQPLDKPVSSDAEKTLAALNALSPLVANKVLESMSAAEIRALIGLTGDKPEETTNPTPEENNNAGK